MKFTTNAFVTATNGARVHTNGRGTKKLIQGAAVVALAFISGGSTDRFVGGSVVSATDGGEARILATSCTNVSDCEGYKGCTSDDNKCKCKNNKCRKKLRDCRIIGPRMSNWSCPPTKECVAQRKWGKCRSIGKAEIFHDSYEFAKNESPESIVFDSKGNAYVSLSLNAFISVLNPEGEEFYRIDMPQGDCRPEAPTDISFPLDTLQFGLAMSKDDTLFVSLLACAEGFPQPPNPNPNTGLWMVNTEDYSIKHIALVPGANGRGRQEECCEWNEAYYSEGGYFGPWTEEMGHMPDGSCNLEACAFYEAWYGSPLFGITPPFRGYAELWNGLEVVGDCVYITNSYFHEVQRACPSQENDEDMWEVELWLRNSDVGPDLERLPGTLFSTAGFNGIKYFEDALYIANTAQGKIVKVPMLPANPDPVTTVTAIIGATGGRGVVPGTPELIFQGGDVDEFTIDKKGNIYAALFEDNKVLKISPDGTSEVLLDGGESYTANCPQFGNGMWIEDYNPLPMIDLPTSVAFGTNSETNEMTLYVASSAFVFFKSCAGYPILKPDGSYAYYPGYPGLSRIFVGEEGAEQMW